MIANDLGDRVTPAVVAFTDHDEVSRAFSISFRKMRFFMSFYSWGLRFLHLWYRYGAVVFCLFGRLLVSLPNRTSIETQLTRSATLSDCWVERLMTKMFRLLFRLVLSRYSIHSVQLLVDDGRWLVLLVVE